MFEWTSHPQPVQEKDGVSQDLQFITAMAAAAILAAMDRRAEPRGPPRAPVGEGVRVQRINIPDSFWTHKLVVEPPRGGTFLEIEDLQLARDSLMDLLRTQLPFQIKLHVACKMVRTTREGAVERTNTGFHLSPWKVLPRANVDDRMARIVAAARNKFELHLENLRFCEIDWAVEGILRIEILATPSTEMLDLPAPGAAAELAEAQVGAGRVHRLPPELANNKGVWNPQNKDNSCFAWCARAAMLGIDQAPANVRQQSAFCGDFFYHKDRQIGKRRHRRTQKTLKNVGLDFSCLPTDRGVTFEDIDAFERLNAGKVQVFVRSWMVTEWRGHRYPRAPQVRVPSVPWAQKTVELLLYREAPGKEHFMLIYDGRKFEGRQGARLGEFRKQAHSFCSMRCPRCGRPFKDREGLQRHQAELCSENAGERFSTVRMPDASKPAERLLRFKASNACEMAPQMTYVDAEVFSSKPPEGLEAVSTHRKQHRLASLAYCTVGANGFQDHLPERHKMWLDRCEEGDGPNGLPKRFLESLLDLYDTYKNWKDAVNRSGAPGTDEQRAAFAAATACQMCHAGFRRVGKQVKCWHHRHGTGEYLGALRSSCNSAVQQPRHLTFVLHNGGGYDFHFLLRAAARLRNLREDQDDGDEDQEESETVSQVSEFELTSQDEGAAARRDWSSMRLTVLQKSGEKSLQFQFGPLRFIDSSNTYKESLGSLIDELKQDLADDQVSSAFPIIAARHPELQKDKLTDERRRRLHSLFGDVGTGWDMFDDELYLIWTWKLLLRKLPMPFDEMTGPSDWSRGPVWQQHEYDSELAGRRCDDETYRSICETAWAMCWLDFRQYHDCYLHMDLALADVMEAFRREFFERFGLDALQYVTLPSAAWDAMKRECLNPRALELITERKLYDRIRKSIMGGLSCIFQPYAEANNPRLKDAKYNAAAACSEILYLDVNSMYPAIMRLPLPVSRGSEEPLPADNDERLRWLHQLLQEVRYDKKDERFCHLLVVDYDFPPERHDSLDWAPPAKMTVQEEMMSEHTGKVYYGSASPTYNNLFPQSLKIFMRTLPAVHLACLFLETALQLAIQKTATPNCCGTVVDPVSLPLPLAKWQYVRWLHEPFLHSHFKSVFDKNTTLYSNLFNLFFRFLGTSYILFASQTHNQPEPQSHTRPEQKTVKTFRALAGQYCQNFKKSS